MMHGRKKHQVVYDCIIYILYYILGAICLQVPHISIPFSRDPSTVHNSAIHHHVLNDQLQYCVLIERERKRERERETERQRERVFPS